MWSAGDTDALAHLDQLQASTNGADPMKGMEGFGLPAFQTGDGQAAFIRDGKTLLVDATDLPDGLGAKGDRTVRTSPTPSPPACSPAGPSTPATATDQALPEPARVGGSWGVHSRSRVTRTSSTSSPSASRGGPLPWQIRARS